MSRGTVLRAARIGVVVTAVVFVAASVFGLYVLSADIQTEEQTLEEKS